MYSYIVSWFGFYLDNCLEFLVVIYFRFSFLFDLHFLCGNEFIIVSVDIIFKFGLVSMMCNLAMVQKSKCVRILKESNLVGD